MFSQLNKCGDDSEKDPPVPIPNTVVKLLSAEDSEGFPFVKAGRCHSFLLIVFKLNIFTLFRNSSVGRAHDC